MPTTLTYKNGEPIQIGDIAIFPTSDYREKVIGIVRAGSSSSTEDNVRVEPVAQVWQSALGITQASYLAAAEDFCASSGSLLYRAPSSGGPAGPGGPSTPVTPASEG